MPVLQRATRVGNHHCVLDCRVGGSAGYAHDWTLSSFTSEYCTAFLVVDRIRVTPSSHPKQMKPDAARYSVEMTLLSIFISKSLMK